MRLTNAMKVRIRQFVCDVIEADGKLGERREKMGKYIERLEAQQLKTSYFPFIGCSHVPVPMLAIARDSIQARLVNDILGSDRDLNCEPLFDESIDDVVDPDTGKALTWRDISEGFQEYINYETSPGGQINFRKFVEDVLDDKTLMGTAFPIVEWLTRSKHTITDEGVKGRTVDYDNVILRVPNFDRLIFPHGYANFDRIPFVSEKYLLRPSEIKLRGAADETGIWDTDEVNRFLAQHNSGVEFSDFDKIRDDIENDDSGIMYSARETLVCETWGMVDLFGDGREYPLVIDHSLDKSNPAIFRVIPWPYRHGRRKFLNPAQYIRRKERMFGMGVIERGQNLDEAITTVVNQIIDKGTLSNTAMFSIDENVVGIQELTRIAPMRFVPRGDNPDAIRELQIGSSNPTIFEGFNILLQLFERVIKVSDYDLGRDSQQMGKDATATGTLAMLKQSGQYYDAHTRPTRATANEAAFHMMQLIAQQKPVDRVASILGREKARLVIGVLNSLEPAELSRRIGLYVAYSKDAATQELRRQQDMAKFQILQTYSTALLTLADMWFTQPYKQSLLQKIGDDAYVQMKKLLEDWGETSTKTLPSLSDLLKGTTPDQRALAILQQQMQSAMAQAPNGTSAQPSEGPQSPPGQPTPGAQASPADMGMQGGTMNPAAQMGG